jgi:hypothetical protein
MRIFTSNQPLSWGKLDLPLCGLTEDWFGTPLTPPSIFTLAKDEEFLWFIAVFPHLSTIHPAASPRQFTPELWKYDVAELFLANPTTGEYLEFNLTSNGAWWASKFSSVRQPAGTQPPFTEHIQSHQDPGESHQCVVGLEIPLDFLKREIGFSFDTTANVTIIRDSPSPSYLSASKLPGDEPDFHQPGRFPTVTFESIPSV